MIAHLSLQSHPEGGYYRETFRSQQRLATARGIRSHSSAILFLATPERPSRFHRLTSDELWFFHGGAPLELTILLPDGGSDVAVLAGGERLGEAERFMPQAIVPGGAWQAARPLAERGRGQWSLVSCVVVPGFDEADFELGERDALVRAYPAQSELIVALT